MGRLADEAAKWQPRGVEAYNLRRKYTVPLGPWRDFFFAKRSWGKTARFRGVELTNSLGLGLGLMQHDERWLLHVHLLWPNIYLTIGKAKDRSYEDRPSYSFSFTDGGRGPSLFLRWGKRTKIIEAPTAPTHVRREWLHADGHWVAETRTRFWKGMTDAQRTAAWDAQTAQRKVEEEQQWQTVCEWFYRTRQCELQEGTALITVERRTWRQWWLQWTPLFQRQSTSIDVAFSREVGSRAGSWKGGTIGCSYEIRKDETPVDCFRRMMDERSFDR